jgi:hypothetical protein
MNTKKIAQQIPTVRPMTAAYATADNFNLTTHKLVSPKTAMGCRSAVQLGNGPQVGITKTTKGGKRLYDNLLTYFSKPKNVLLSSASTFKMTYNNKTAFPSIPRKTPTAKNGILQREKHDDSFLAKARMKIVLLHDTFKVGIRDVKAIDKNDNARPPSPNPVRIWATRKNVDIEERNNEIMAKMLASQTVNV